MSPSGMNPNFPRDGNTHQYTNDNSANYTACITKLIIMRLNVGKVHVYYSVSLLKCIYDQLTLRKYFMHAKMKHTFQSLCYIKHRQISANRTEPE